MSTQITYKNGEETQASVKRRIAEVTGFQYSKIVLLEGSLRKGLRGQIYTSVCFRVNGKGAWTDFNTWELDPVYDEAKGKC